MYAVIKAGGKQQKVQAGDVIEVEHVRADDGTVEFRPILVVDDEGKTHFGKDAQKAVVVAKAVGEQKGDKVKVFKYKSKTGYSRRQGHRQKLTVLEIQDIKFGGGSRRAAKTESAPAEAAEKPQAESTPEPAESKPARKTKAPQAESAPETADES